MMSNRFATLPNVCQVNYHAVSFRVDWNVANNRPNYQSEGIVWRMPWENESVAESKLIVGLNSIRGRGSSGVASLSLVCWWSPRVMLPMMRVPKKLTLAIAKWSLVSNSVSSWWALAVLDMNEIARVMVRVIVVNFMCCFFGCWYADTNHPNSSREGMQSPKFRRLWQKYHSFDR